RSGRVEELAPVLVDEAFRKLVQAGAARVVDAHRHVSEAVDEAVVDPEILGRHGQRARPIDEPPERALTDRRQSLAESPGLIELRRDDECARVIDVTPFAALRRRTKPFAEWPGATAVPVEPRLDHHLPRRVDEADAVADLHTCEAVAEIADIVVGEGNDDLPGGIGESPFAVQKKTRATFAERLDIIVANRAA